MLCYGLADFWPSDEAKQPVFMMAGHKLANFPSAITTPVLQHGCDISGVWIPGAYGDGFKNYVMKVTNADKTKYVIMSRDQNAGRGHSMKIDNNSVERVEEFKYLGTTLTNQNSI